MIVKSGNLIGYIGFCFAVACFCDIISGIFIYGMLVAELLALLRTALDSESSDGEEIYPLFTQSRRHTILNNHNGSGSGR